MQCSDRVSREQGAPHAFTGSIRGEGWSGMDGLTPERPQEQDLLRLATVGLMTAGIAHDLGNLVQVVVSAVRLLDRSLGPEVRSEVEPLLRGAIGAADRAAALSGRVLDLSRSATVVDEIADLNATLKSLAPMTALTAGPGVTVGYKLAEGAPTVVCNTRELENAVLNLVANARDAMNGDGRVEIGTRGVERVSAEGCPMVELRVSDTGPGMPDAILGEVFRPFFTTKTEGRGAGLGLAMVSDFARRVGGSAEVDSAVGVGTAVILRLPACGA